MTAGLIDCIQTPKQGNRALPHVAWCADNGCFTDKWTEADWWQFLLDNAHRADSCVFATAPDVVGDAWATHLRSMPWLPKIRALGYPVAYVAQNGVRSSRLPWDHFDVLFLGGSLECLPCGYVYSEPRRPRRGEPCPFCHRRLTEWKLDETARALTFEAKRRGKHVHMGRVNSERRWRYADAIGVDSVDGTFLTFGADQNLPKLLAWVRNNDQGALFGGAA